MVLRVLAYHGVSISDFVSSLRSVSFEQRAMMAMLERRHLPPHGGARLHCPPSRRTRWSSRPFPIFSSGHVHGHHASQYKGTHIIHSSTWQNQTDYQRMLGFQLAMHTYCSESGNPRRRFYSVRLTRNPPLRRAGARCFLNHQNPKSGQRPSKASGTSSHSG